MEKKLTDAWLQKKIADKKVRFDDTAELVTAPNSPILVFMNVLGENGEPSYLFRVNVSKKTVDCVKVDSMEDDYEYLPFSWDEKDFFKKSKVFKDIFLKMVDDQYDAFPKSANYTEWKDGAPGREKAKKLFADTINPNGYFFFHDEYKRRK